LMTANEGSRRPYGAVLIEVDASPGLRPPRHPSGEDLSPGTPAAADLPWAIFLPSLRDDVLTPGDHAARANLLRYQKR
jgi:hypothetical protein